MDLGASVARHKTSLVLLLAFTALYLVTGLWLNGTKLRATGDILFGSDQSRVRDSIVNAQANHYRTEAHPLFVLFLNPVGSRLASLTEHAIELAARTPAIEKRLRSLGSKDDGKSIARRAAEILTSTFLNALAGAAAVALFCAALRRLGFLPMDALVFALLYGFSAGNWFWGAINETHTFAGVSAAALLWLTACARTGLIPVGLAALWGFGCVASALAYAQCVHTVGRLMQARAGASVLVRLVEGARSGLLTAAILGIAVPLVLLQNALYPSTTMQAFFKAEAVRVELGYLAGKQSEPWAPTRIAVTLAHVALFYHAAPGISLRADAVSPPQRPAIGLSAAARDFGVLGIAGAGAWLAAFCLAAATAGRAMRTLPTFWWCAALCTLFNVALFSVYGMRAELFLYAPHCTPFTVALLAACWNPLLGNHTSARWPRAAVWTLLALTIAANAAFLLTVYRLYR